MLPRYDILVLTRGGVGAQVRILPPKLNPLSHLQIQGLGSDYLDLGSLSIGRPSCTGPVPAMALRESIGDSEY